MSTHAEKNNTCDYGVMDQIAQATVFIPDGICSAPFGIGEKSHTPIWQEWVTESPGSVPLGSPLGLIVAVSVGLDHWGNVQSMWPL